MAAGQVGLMKAIAKFDPNNEKKASFYTYSFYWIKSEIQQFRHRNESIIKIPASRQKSEHTFVSDYQKIERKLMDSDNKTNVKSI